MSFEEMNLPMIKKIAKFYERQTNCSDLESFQLAIQSYQVQAYQDQTDAIKKLTNAIKDGLGVTSTNSIPKFIEAVAMSIGYGTKDGPNLIEILSEVRDELSDLNEKFPPYNPQLSEKDLEAYKPRKEW